MTAARTHRGGLLVAGGILAAGLLLAGLGDPVPVPDRDADRDPGPVEAPRLPTAPAGPGSGGPAPASLVVPGIERVVRIDERLITGSDPSAEGIEHLGRLGVEVLLSVDARRPLVEEARRAGLRVVHLPIGYDGVPEERIQALVALLAEESGPVYVHCHQGRHRGPAVAAILWMLSSGVEPDVATGLLARCGTDPRYEGLWSAVRGFRPPGTPSTPPRLPEWIEAGGLAEVMVRIDDARDRLESSPDPQRERLLMEQLFRELGRPGLHPGADRHTMPPDALADAIAALRSLEEGVTPAALERLDTTCTACHARTRR
ncbi:MAG: sulfur transferase domain-containing protein [Planctomycetota bacterium]|nr:sulfur transferase domain-containing protein [Planctomycetota bacterium]